MTDSATRVIWKPVRDTPVKRTWDDWEEHRGVVDHRTAERIAGEFGVSLEIG